MIPLKASLNNLGLEYIDLLVIHKNDANCPLEEVMRAMTYLVDSGQIMYWATARWSPFELFEAYSKVSFVQSTLFKSSGKDNKKIAREI